MVGPTSQLLAKQAILGLWVASTNFLFLSLSHQKKLRKRKAHVTGSHRFMKGKNWKEGNINRIKSAVVLLGEIPLDLVR